jgi:hypothetical protein
MTNDEIMTKPNGEKGHVSSLVISFIDSDFVIRISFVIRHLAEILAEPRAEF